MFGRVVSNLRKKAKKSSSKAKASSKLSNSQSSPSFCARSTKNNVDYFSSFSQETTDEEGDEVLSILSQSRSMCIHHCPNDTECCLVTASSSRSLNLPNLTNNCGDDSQHRDSAGVDGGDWKAIRVYSKCSLEQFCEIVEET